MNLRVKQQSILAVAAAALWLILMRIGQGIGGACLAANSSAIIADAFPPDQLGFAMGILSVASVSGAFLDIGTPESLAGAAGVLAGLAELEDR